MATQDGWFCPMPGCDYTQIWAHAFMADPAWLREKQARHRGFFPRTDEATS